MCRWGGRPNSLETRLTDHGAVRVLCAALPGWRNGRRMRLKIVCPQGRVGSSPTPGTRGPVQAIAPDGA